MKKIRFDKLITLTVDESEKETLVVVNGVKLRLEEGVLKEKIIGQVPYKEFKEIEAKYKVEGEDLTPEQGEKIQEEINALAESCATFSEIQLWI
jgi:hypothetical protein